MGDGDVHAGGAGDKRRLQVQRLDVEMACSLRTRLRGLLGRDAIEGVLAIAPCRDIHTFGMRRSIDVAFVAPDGSVIAARRELPPNRRMKCRGSFAVLERFSDGSPWLRPGDRVRPLLELRFAETRGEGGGNEGLPDMPFEGV